jgi:hypothetical protein
MMIFNPYFYLFYCFYKAFKSIKRQIDLDHELASISLALILTLLLLSILIIVGLARVVPISGFVIALGGYGSLYYFNKCIFLKEKKYKKIVQIYNSNPNISGTFSKLLAIALTLGTFLLFYLSVDGYFE